MKGDCEMDDKREMMITPKFWEHLRELGATEFEMAAFLLPGTRGTLDGDDPDTRRRARR